LSSNLATARKDSPTGHQQQHADVTEDNKKSKTPSSPKQKAKTGRKASQAVVNAAVVGLHEDESSLAIAAHYYPSFIESFISKILSLTAVIYSRKQLFEHLNELNANVPINECG
jgi:hypothetical protein